MLDPSRTASLVVVGLTGALVLFGLVSLLVFAMRRRMRVPENATPRQHSFFLHYAVREWWRHESDPLAARLVRAGCHPNTLTYLSLALSMASGVFFAIDQTAIAGLLLLLGGAADSLDGRVARQSTRISNRGAFLDSSLDRFGEMAVFLGLAVLFRDGPILYAVLLGLAGAVMVSYARARGQSLGVDFSAGWMQRPERIVYIACAALLDQPSRMAMDMAGFVPDSFILQGVLVLVAVLALSTAVYRVIAISKRL